MKDILFEKLTVEEQEEVRAGAEISPNPMDCIEEPKPEIQCTP